MRVDTLHRIVRFVIAGITAAVVNVAMLYVLVDYMRVYYLIASICSFLLSVGVGFTLQKFWAFRDTTTAQAHIQLIKYGLITTTNLVVNTLLMYFFVSILGMWYVAAQVFSGIAIAVISYTANSFFVFTNSDIS